MRIVMKLSRLRVVSSATPTTISRLEQQTMDPLHRNLQASFGKDELIDGIPSSDWMTYIGTAAPAYLNDYSSYICSISSSVVKFLMM